MLRHPDRSRKPNRLPSSVYWLYGVGVFNLVLLAVNYGWVALVWSAGACVMFWAAALMHERYVTR